MSYRYQVPLSQVQRRLDDLIQRQEPPDQTEIESLKLIWERDYKSNMHTDYHGLIEDRIAQAQSRLANQRLSA